MNKRAYMRTLEAFIAFIMTFTFLIFIASTRESAAVPEHPQLYVLHNFEQRPDFRSCVYSSNVSCMQEMINSSIPRSYGFHITINDASYQRDENVFIDTLYVTGSAASSQHVVRLYYWKEH